jgi:Fur family ferric uptake transcriptional regulator
MIANNLKIATLLKDTGYSLTKPRLAVFGLLERTEPLSMSDLVTRLPDVDRASIYRTIELFERLGAVNRLQMGWKYKLELSDLFSDHHHHATCVSCGKMNAIEEDAEIERKIHDLAEKNHFQLASHSLEIRGLCLACQSSP